MKVVVTAQGNELSSEVDLRFGRAQNLIVIDTEAGDFQAHSNTVNLDASQGAGIQTGRNVAEFGAEALIIGNVGPNAFKTLSAAGVKVFLAVQQTVADFVPLTAGFVKRFQHRGNGLEILESPKLFFFDFFAFCAHERY